MTFRPPVTPRLSDEVAEHVRREHHRAIVEIQSTLNTNTPGTGVYLGRQLFASNGLYVPAAGAKNAVVWLVGGGGGGGGAGGSASGASAGAGGSSGVVVHFHVSSSTRLTGGAVTIGAGGSGGANTGGNGSIGGDSTILINGITYTAKGGGAGGGMAGGITNGNVNPSNPAVGSSSGDSQAWGSGGFGVVIAAAMWFSGSGGSCPFGAGGIGIGGNTNGTNASGYGGGGGGAASTTTGHAGGNGSGGICIIDEWS